MKCIFSFIFIFCLFLRQSVLLENKTKNSTSKKGINKEKCTYNGIPLKGIVKIVNSFPDLKVKIINSFPNIKIKIVNFFSKRCREWQFVGNFPDVKIKFVGSLSEMR